MESGCIAFNLNGFRYEISKEKVYQTFGNSSKLTKQLSEFPLNKEIRVDRPRHVFEAILDYCNTGHLHIPRNVCTGAFVEEMEFWEIDPRCLERCCFHRYATYIRDRENLNYFLQSLQPNEEEISEKSSNMSLKQKVWRAVEGRAETVGSKTLQTNQTFLFQICGSVSLFFVVLTILNIALSTVQLSQMDSMGIHVGDKGSLMTEDTPTSFMDHREHSENHAVYISTFNTNISWENDTSLNNSTVEDTASFIFPDDAHQKILTTSQAQNSTMVHLYLEHIANAFFTVELIVRLFACPSIPRYFRDSFNILDFVLLVSSYGRYVVMIADKYGSNVDADFILYLQMFRVLRIVRFLKHVTAFQILCFSLKLGIRDLLMMCLFLTMGILIFSNFLYYMESSKDVPSIPDAWWFSIVTMTTVGFGDITPKTVTGKIIGGLCALTGVMMFSLIIPIFVNTFQHLYQYVALKERREVRYDAKQIGAVSMRDIEVRFQEL
ncbi:hypothetical protein FSP39_021195 [Pinctada imbricata]|uniref:BTB domain-containing protein n=1 Tax=Pinctada imbricata TaxID=66713 RepID=A0AA89C459_PINIB|nr:hypothetical protein FSP39_021195 [Pinctada imbricata]